LLDRELYYLSTELSLYDKSGRLTTKSFWDSKDKLVRKSEFVYNQKNQLTLITVFYSSSEPDEEVYEYDAPGRKIKTKFYSNKKLRKYYDFFYEGEGHQLTSQKTYLIGELISFDQFIYNKAGRLIRFESHNKKGEKTEEKQIKYNQEGQIVESVILYLKDNALIPWGKVVTYYDEDEERSEVIWYLKNGEVDSHYLYEYEFDDIGNLIQMKTFQNGFLVHRLEREIEYY
ncbi:MAG: hypothetical protein GX154_08510, partial [Clostridiales bacterium]|nr:hypothetical protein [Clostridiales bacterium]